tara:strand:- start:2173 stop:2412 length:240 start_codon:yes stop_codon:yes gene_type:complete
MKNDCTLQDVLKQIKTTESEIDYLKRVFEKAENRIDETDRKTYQDYIWKLEDTILEFKTELEDSVKEQQQSMRYMRNEA